MRSCQCWITASTVVWHALSTSCFFISHKVCSKWTCNRFKIMKIIFGKRLFSALKRVWYTYCHWYLQCYERLISMQQTSAIRPSPSFHSGISLVATVWAVAPYTCDFQVAHRVHERSAQERLCLLVADMAAAWRRRVAVKSESLGIAALHVGPWWQYYMKD